jgi:hypothetical protein
MEWLTILMLERPKTVSAVGKLLFNVGGLATVLGIWGTLALQAIASAVKFGPASSVTRGLADAYPTYPTWWVPESAAGFAMSIGIAALGIWLVMATKHLNRTFR